MTIKNKETTCLQALLLLHNIWWKLIDIITIVIIVLLIYRKARILHSMCGPLFTLYSSLYSHI